jgi:hypothetical protein
MPTGEIIKMVEHNLRKNPEKLKEFKIDPLNLNSKASSASAASKVRIKRPPRSRIAVLALGATALGAAYGLGHYKGQNIDSKELKAENIEVEQ